MTTTPDINVRVARARDVASTRHARRSPLARLLLKTGVKLLLSFAAASSMSACIIPVGPEFQDPPGGPNAAPEILNPNFFTGTAVASTSTQDFSFTVSDPNGDPMWFRWV